MNKKVLNSLPTVLFFSIFALVGFIVIQTVIAATVTSSVTVGNATPTASSVLVNGGSAITLVASTTQNVNVGMIITDANGCSDVLTNGTTTVYLYRGPASSTCVGGAANNLNCYITGLTSSACVGTSTTAVATTTIPVYYLAQATDSSSSFPGTTWKATVIVKDASNASSSGDYSTGVTMNTLNAFNLSTSSIAYGTVPAGSDTGSTNQTVNIIDVGNSSTTASLSGTNMASGANVMPTSSQKYATTTPFTFSSAGVALSDTPTNIAGFAITAPTSTASIDLKGTFWGFGTPNGTPTGAYNATTTYTIVWTP